MKKLKVFKEGPWIEGDIEQRYEEWIEENANVNVLELSASESSTGSSTRRTLYVLYEEGVQL